MKMKKLLLGMTGLMITVTLAACGSSSDGSSTSDDKVRLRFSSWDSEESLTLQQKLVDKFNEDHPDIEVTLEAYGSDYDTKISAGIGAKDAPDIMYMWNYPQYKDALEPLDAYLEKEGADYKENFYETLWNYNSIDDAIYGIPVGFTTHGVFYNKKMFDEAGISYPEGEWSWDDLKEMAKKLTDPSSNMYGFAMPGKPDPYDFEMYLWSNGTAYSDDNGSLNGYVDSKESIAVFDKFQEMLKNETAIATEGDGATEMSSGNVAMFVNGSWAMNTLADAGIEYGLAQLPDYGNKKSASIISSSGVAMSKYSKHKEEAFEFIKYWTGEQANKERIDYELPVLKSVVSSEGIENDPVKSVFYTMLNRSEAFTPTSFKTDSWSDISEDLSLSFERIFNPSQLDSPKDVLKDIVK